MKYKKFGNTDESLSAISLGSWGIGGVGWGDTDEKQSEAAVCMDLSIRQNQILVLDLQSPFWEKSLKLREKTFFS